MHRSVLLDEALELLAIKPNGRYADATGGAGGHAQAILSRLSPEGFLIVGDQDPQAVSFLKNKFSDEKRCRVVKTPFSRLSGELKTLGENPLDGLIADLGFSSVQLAREGLGLSFKMEGPLDMRLDPEREMTAADVLVRYDEKELADIFFAYGEERQSRRIARAIVHDRDETPFETTLQLAGLCERVLGKYYRRGGIHPATKVFQALRIFVNGELEELKGLLNDLPLLLGEGGRAVFITFHSLEDRMVKQAFAALKEKGWKAVTKKPVRPGEKEVAENPRSRSAKLRVIEKGRVGVASD